MLSTFTELLKVDSIRVYPPKKYVLLCGGEVGSIVDADPRSIRDAFLRGNTSHATGGSDIIKIEDIEEFFEKDSPYTDLMDFERDIAQICELVLLFSESPGSFAELGAFSLLEEVSQKLLLVIQRKFIDRPSFITKGPILKISNRNEKALFTVTDASLGISNGSVNSINSNSLISILKNPINDRLIEIKSRTSLDVSKFNHLCKCYVGLLREFYALKDDELVELLSGIGFHVDKEILKKAAFCCAALRWSRCTRLGFDNVHYALPGNEAASFSFESDFGDKIRRRTELRQHWDATDPDRIAAVDEAVKV